MTITLKIDEKFNTALAVTVVGSNSNETNVMNDLKGIKDHDGDTLIINDKGISYWQSEVNNL